MIVCVAEDRKSCEASVKLLLLSIARHCENLAVELFYPVADSRFIAWLRKCPRVHLNLEPVPKAYGWNVKPQALLALMERGHDDLLWIDSDVIATRDFLPLFAGLRPATVVVAEEALYGGHADTGALRTRGWGFEVGRELPFSVNTALLRVTRSHIPLLQRWRELLENEEYRQAQRLIWHQRPVHLFGDQDVLTALLASRPFADVELRYLRRGPDIIQYFGVYGYTCPERAGHLLRGIAPFVHSQGFKPWLGAEAKPKIRNGREYFDGLYLDASPYTLAARPYQTDLEDNCDWMRPRLVGGAILRAAGLWRPPLVGWPLALVADGVRMGKKALGRA